MYSGQSSSINLNTENSLPTFSSDEELTSSKNKVSSIAPDVANQNVSTENAAQFSSNEPNSNPSNNGNVFNTDFMSTAVGYLSEMNAREFSISEYLELDLQDEVSKECLCCLCVLCQANNMTTKVCVKNHPHSLPCQKFAPLMQKLTVCKTCMDSMTMNSKEEEDTSNMFSCIFVECLVKLKTFSVQKLQSHYLKHLNVSKFMCSICENGFNTKTALKSHERNH